MSSQTVCRFPLPDLESLPEDIRQRIAEVQERAGFIVDEDIWDIGSIAAFFGLSNRIVNMSSMRTNDEFYLMGRVPREK